MGAMYLDVSCFTPEKRPRHYAAELLALPRAERRAALDQVPEALRSWVRELVTDHIEKRRCLRLWRNAHETP
jgi:hypothetical protein